MSNSFQHRAALFTIAAGAALFSLTDTALALDHPNGVAVDAKGYLYVADSGDVQQGRAGDISIYTVAVTSTGVNATLKGKITSNISNPYSVAVSPFGTIYAGNLSNNSITVYSPTLAQVGTISDPSITTYAVNMFVDQGGDLWVLDAGGKVHTYLDNLTPVSTLSVGAIATALTSWGSNVAIWGRNATGISTLTANMGEAVHGNAAFNGNFANGALVPTGVAENSFHQQFATNSTAGIITVYSADFSQVAASFTGYGTAIAIDSIRQRIYTTVPSSNAVFVYSAKSPYKFLGKF